MKPNLFQNEISVRKSSIQGYGVFADKDILPGEIIEECYGFNVAGIEAELVDYYFKAKDNRSFMPSGYGALYNHSDTPNANYMLDQENSILEIKANKKIRRGEEIFISYGKKWFDKRNMTVKKPSWRYYAKRVWRSMLFRGALLAFVCYLPKILLNLSG